ncbi:MAG: oxygenase MpaB family protein [Moraxellaceae bacterium]
MTKYESNMTPSSNSRIEMSWPEPLTAKEWDDRFPGVLDGLGFLAGPANVIMQLARLPVGYGVKESRVESGSVLKHPFKRARTTAAYLAVSMIGTTEERLAYRQAVNRAHAHVHSTEESPVKYNAFNPDLQMWVAACLYWGFADTSTRFNKPWTPEQAAEFYRLAVPLGTTLQVRADMWPEDIEAFQVYWEKELDALKLDDTIRKYLADLIEFKHLPVLSRVIGPFNRFVTAGFLPQKLRNEMHYEWTAKDQKNFNRFLMVAGCINGVLPRPVRQAGTLLVMADLRRRMRKGLSLV